MAVDRTPVLKRCRSLELDPIVLGINKKSNRQPRRQRRNESEYGRQLREKQNNDNNPNPILIPWKQNFYKPNIQVCFHVLTCSLIGLGEIQHLDNNNSRRTIILIEFFLKLFW